MNSRRNKLCVGILSLLLAGSTSFGGYTITPVGTAVGFDRPSNGAWIPQFTYRPFGAGLRFNFYPSVLSLDFSYNAGGLNLARVLYTDGSWEDITLSSSRSASELPVTPPAGLKIAALEVTMQNNLGGYANTYIQDYVNDETEYVYPAPAKWARYDDRLHYDVTRIYRTEDEMYQSFGVSPDSIRFIETVCLDDGNVNAHTAGSGIQFDTKVPVYQARIAALAGLDYSMDGSEVVITAYYSDGSSSSVCEDEYIRFEDMDSYNLYTKVGTFTAPEGASIARVTIQSFNDDPSANVSAIFAPLVCDTDSDGLMDSEERDLGTSIVSSDSDGDEVSDWDEVNVYHTSPTEFTEDELYYAAPADYVRSGSRTPGSQFNPYASINEALTHVPEGGTLNLCGGVYHEAVTVQRRGITIIGAVDNEGMPASVIDPEGENKPGIYVPAIRQGGATIENIEVINAAYDPERPAQHGAEAAQSGVLVASCVDVTLRNVCAHDCQKLGIFVIGSTDVRLEDCITYGNGESGVKLHTSPGTVIDNGDCSENAVHGIFMWDCPTVKIFNSELCDNGNCGIALFNYNVPAEDDSWIFSNEISGNSRGVSAHGVLDNLWVSANNFDNNAWIACDVSTPGENMTHLGHFTYNNIRGDGSLLIRVEGGCSINDISYNYYGSTDLSGINARISGMTINSQDQCAPESLVEAGDLGYDFGL